MLSRHSLSAIEGSIRYVLNEEKSAGIDSGKTCPILQNLRSDSTDISSIANEMMHNESYRKVTSNRVFMYHEIVSFGSGDKDLISADIVNDVAQVYLELRGDDLVSIAVPHYNTDSIHIHLISGGTRYRGGSSGYKKAELLKIKQQLEMYVQTTYPELTNSRVEHGSNKNYLSEKEYQAGKKKITRKENLRYLVNKVLSASKTRAEFIESLAKEGYLVYERNSDGVMSGIVPLEGKGRKHRFSTLGINQEQILQLHTEQEKSREEQLLERLRSINESTHENTNDLER